MASNRYEVTIEYAHTFFTVYSDGVHSGATYKYGHVGRSPSGAWYDGLTNRAVSNELSEALETAWRQLREQVAS